MYMTPKTAEQKAAEKDESKKMIDEWGNRIVQLTAAMTRLATAMEVFVATKALGTGQ